MFWKSLGIIQLWIEPYCLHFGDWKKIKLVFKTKLAEGCRKCQSFISKSGHFWSVFINKYIEYFCGIKKIRLRIKNYDKEFVYLTLSKYELQSMNANISFLGGCFCQIRIIFFWNYFLPYVQEVVTLQKKYSNIFASEN